MFAVGKSAEHFVSFDDFNIFFGFGENRRHLKFRSTSFDCFLLFLLRLNRIRSKWKDWSEKSSKFFYKLLLTVYPWEICKQFDPYSCFSSVGRSSKDRNPLCLLKDLERLSEWKSVRDLKSRKENRREKERSSPRRTGIQNFSGICPSLNLIDPATKTSAGPS